MSPSYFSVFAAGLAALAPLASAYTTPVGASPSGNPIYTPSLHQVVPVGKAFNITWNPTTKGNVALVLLKGPSDNAVAYSTIADSIDNSGSYLWTPSTELSPNTTGYGYGIELIVEKTGEYQYSTQFGIENPDYTESSTSSSSASDSSSTVAAVIDAANATANATAITTATSSASAYKVTGVPSSGWMPANGTYPKPTGTITVPSSLKTASQTTLTSVKTASSAAASVTGASASASATQTGAAAHFGASVGGLVIVAGMAVFAL